MPASLLSHPVLLPDSLSFIAVLLDRGTTADDYVIFLRTMWLANTSARNIYVGIKAVMTLGKLISYA